MRHPDFITRAIAEIGVPHFAIEYLPGNMSKPPRGQIATLLGKGRDVVQRVTVHGPEEWGTAIQRVSPPPTPPHNVADLSESVMASSFAATMRGGGHAPPRERLLQRLGRSGYDFGTESWILNFHTPE